MAGDIFVGQHGFAIEVSLFNATSDSAGIYPEMTREPIDLSEAEVITLILRSPAGVCVRKPADVVGDPKDGRILYLVEEGTFDAHGNWRAQVVLVMPNGLWMSDISAFQVKAPLCPEPDPD